MASCSAPSRASARSTSSRSITGPEGPVTPIDHLSLREELRETVCEESREDCS